MKTKLLALASVAVAASIGTTLAVKHQHIGDVAEASPFLPAPSGNQPIADVAERVVPSVVNIHTTTTIANRGPRHSDPFFNNPRSPFFNGPQSRQEGQSLGSGVIVSRQGHILTNSHVINGANKIRVSLHNGKQYNARVVGSDPMSDVAVVKLNNPPANLKPVAFANSDQVRLGEVVIAIGNPFGVGQAVTMGIISAKGRANVGIVRYEDFIQTDAAINPGNSGGALINMKGQLVGINTAILSRSGGYQGIGFAIPANMARKIKNDLIKNGKFSRGYLGISMNQLSPDLARKLASTAKAGVVVMSVEPNSPAQRAGLTTGDVITQVDGKNVSSMGQLRNLVAMKGAGSAAQFTVERKGSYKTLSAQLTELDPKIFKRRR